MRRRAERAQPRPRRSASGKGTPRRLPAWGPRPTSSLYGGFRAPSDGSRERSRGAEPVNNPAPGAPRTRSAGKPPCRSSCSGTRPGGRCATFGRGCVRSARVVGRPTGKARCVPSHRSSRDAASRAGASPSEPCAAGRTRCRPATRLRCASLHRSYGGASERLVSLAGSLARQPRRGAFPPERADRDPVAAVPTGSATREASRDGGHTEDRNPGQREETGPACGAGSAGMRPLGAPRTPRHSPLDPSPTHATAGTTRVDS